MSIQSLTALVVGVKGMGAHQARILRKLPGFNLAGVCDLNPAIAAERASELARMSSQSAHRTPPTPR